MLRLLKTLAGQLVSRIGDGIHEIALVWLVLELTGSVLSMGAIPAVRGWWLVR
ncbi:MAG: hypothetical protein ACOC86_03110 [Candidatus Bipolaricaulota bacterium]